MEGICFKNGEFVLKYTGSLGKGDSMLAQIRCRLCIVPLKSLHLHDASKGCLKFVEERDAGVLVVEFGELAHDFSAAFVVELGDDDFHGDDLVAALAGG